jgi:hypothetical protein
MIAVAEMVPIIGNEFLHNTDDARIIWRYCYVLSAINRALMLVACRQRNLGALPRIQENHQELRVSLALAPSAQKA